MLTLGMLVSEVHTYLEGPPMLFSHTSLPSYTVFPLLILPSTWLHLQKRPSSTAVFYKVNCWVNLKNCRTQYQKEGNVCFILFQCVAFSMHLCPEPSGLFIIISNKLHKEPLLKSNHLLLVGGLTRTCFRGSEQEG